MQLNEAKARLTLRALPQIGSASQTPGITPLNLDSQAASGSGSRMKAAIPSDMNFDQALELVQVLVAELQSLVHNLL